MKTTARGIEIGDKLTGLFNVYGEPAKDKIVTAVVRRAHETRAYYNTEDVLSFEPSETVLVVR
jgi:hypothetical protein